MTAKLTVSHRANKQALLFWGLFVMGLIPVKTLAQAPAADLTKLSIEELMNVTIESVSKFEQKISEAPASVTIVTSDDIKKFGYRTLADILRSVGGLYVRYDRSFSYLGFRGLGRLGDFNTRFLLLVDGHRMNDDIFGQGFIGNEFNIDADLIDRVEVIRSASSSLYGTSAFLGIVNVKTKTGESLKGVEFSGEGGRFSTYKGRLSYGNKFDNGLELLVSGSRYGSRGDDRLFYKEYNSPATNFGIARNADDEGAGNVFASLSFQDFSLEGGFIKRSKEIPTGAFNTVFNDDDTKTADSRAFLDFKYEREFADQLRFKARVFYDYFKEIGNYIVDYADPGDPPFIVKNIDDLRSQAVGGEWQLSKTLFGGHKLILGAEYKNAFQQDLRNYDIAVYLNKKTQSLNWGIYAQDEFELFKGFRVNAGVRYDRYSSFGGTVNPRVGLVYQPYEKTIFKLLYGQAFRAPSVFDLNYNDGGDTQKAPTKLDPETIRSVEFSAQQYLGFNLWGSARLYYNRIENLIALLTDPADGLLVFQNTKGANQKGVELELEGRWQNGVRGRLSYALQQTEDLDTHKILLNSPTHLVKFNSVAPLWRDKLYLGLETQFTSLRKTILGNPARPYFITNVTLFSEKIINGLEASASVYNVFDKKYSDPAGPEHIQDKLQQDGRGFRFKLTYRF
jgi:outer membrane receptor for ferrienterochelin and colicins